jgi:hypothetical protein
MKLTANRRLARFAGLLTLSMLVLAIAVQAVQAGAVSGGGGGDGSVTSAPAGTQGRGGATLAPVNENPGIAGAPLAPAAAAQAGTPGRGGVNAPTAGSGSGTQAASSGVSSTEAWIIAGSVAALIAVVAAWALLRRRQPSEVASATYCTQHPEDALCRAV